MAILYKLTTRDGKTRKGHTNETQWGDGITHSGTGKGDLCGPGYIHAYADPLLAVLLNVIHANINDPILWECEGDVSKTDHGLKVGCVTLTTIRQIPLPEITIEQRIKFAIYCALEVYSATDFVTWASNWLSGKDRSIETAAAAARAAEAAARAAEAEAGLDLIAIAKKAVS